MLLNNEDLTHHYQNYINTGEHTFSCEDYHIEENFEKMISHSDLEVRIFYKVYGGHYVKQELIEWFSRKKSVTVLQKIFEASIKGIFLKNMPVEILDFEINFSEITDFRFCDGFVNLYVKAGRTIHPVLKEKYEELKSKNSSEDF